MLQMRNLKSRLFSPSFNIDIGFWTSNNQIFQTSPITKSRLQKDDFKFVTPAPPRIVKRNLGLNDDTIPCPQCHYPATKSSDNKGTVELGFIFLDT